MRDDRPPRKADDPDPVRSGADRNAYDRSALVRHGVQFAYGLVFAVVAFFLGVLHVVRFIDERFDSVRDVFSVEGVVFAASTVLALVFLGRGFFGLRQTLGQQRCRIEDEKTARSDERTASR
jgi:hypothetical protein